MEDCDIIELYWRRDQQAVSETAEKYGGFLRGIAWNILRNHGDAEECVNDTYFRAWNAIPPDRPTAFRAWLGRITRNLALTRYRKNTAGKRGGGQTALALEELSECVSGTACTEEELENRELAELINRFLERLPQRQRTIFMRRYWHMASIGDIARAYGMTESQVTSQLFRTRKKLRELLVKEGVAL